MHKQPAKQSPWLSTSEVAGRMNVTDETVRCWVNRGVRPGNCANPVKLRCVRIGKRYCIRRRWLKEFLEALDIAAGTVMPVPQVESIDKRAERAKRAKEEASRRLGRR